MLDPLGRGNLHGEDASLGMTWCQVFWATFLAGDLYGRTQPFVGAVTPGKVVLGCTEKAS